MELKPEQRTGLTSWARSISDSYFWLWPRLELLCEPESLNYKIYPRPCLCCLCPCWWCLLGILCCWPGCWCYWITWVNGYLLLYVLLALIPLNLRVREGALSICLSNWKGCYWARWWLSRWKGCRAHNPCFFCSCLLWLYCRRSLCFRWHSYGEPHPEWLMPLTLLVDIQLDLELRLRLDDLHHMDL